MEHQEIYDTLSNVNGMWMEEPVTEENKGYKWTFVPPTYNIPEAMVMKYHPQKGTRTVEFKIEILDGNLIIRLKKDIIYTLAIDHTGNSMIWTHASGRERKFNLEG